MESAPTNLSRLALPSLTGAEVGSTPFLSYRITVLGYLPTEHRTGKFGEGPRE